MIDDNSQVVYFCFSGCKNSARISLLYSADLVGWGTKDMLHIKSNPTMAGSGTCQKQPYRLKSQQLASIHGPPWQCTPLQEQIQIQTQKLSRSLQRKHSPHKNSSGPPSWSASAREEPRQKRPLPGFGWWLRTCLVLEILTCSSLTHFFTAPSLKVSLTTGPWISTRSLTALKWRGGWFIDICWI